jgi:hypothetical protein
MIAVVVVKLDGSLGSRLDSGSAGGVPEST